MSKIRLMFALVIFDNSSNEILYKFAINSATYFTLAGSFFSPLYGTGVKYGESVSKTILSKEIFFNTSFNLQFLKVTTPLTPNKYPNLIYSNAVSKLPEKEWIK